MMIFHNVFDHVFSTWSHIAVLRVLQDAAKGLTGREIARLASMSHRSCLKALTALERLGIVELQRGGRDHIFSLNRDHILVRDAILPLLSVERKVLDSLTLTLKKKFGKRIESQILFGSVARKEEDSFSDIDVCFIARNEQDREKIHSLANEIAEELKRKFGARLAPLVLSRRDFAKRVRSGKQPAHSLLKEGIVLSGKSIRELTDGAR